VALLGSGPELGERSVENPVLGIDEALEIVRVRGTHAGIMAKRRPAGKENGGAYW
jgi:hypothetical protein